MPTKYSGCYLSIACQKSCCLTFTWYHDAGLLLVHLGISSLMALASAAAARSEAEEQCGWDDPSGNQLKSSPTMVRSPCQSSLLLYGSM